MSFYISYKARYLGKVSQGKLKKKSMPQSRKRKKRFQPKSYVKGNQKSLDSIFNTARN